LATQSATKASVAAIVGVGIILDGSELCGCAARGAGCPASPRPYMSGWLSSDSAAGRGRRDGVRAVRPQRGDVGLHGNGNGGRRDRDDRERDAVLGQVLAALVLHQLRDEVQHWLLLSGFPLSVVLQ